MRTGKVFFHPIEGSAPLSISWSSGPKGDAIEANNELGVGFFSEKGDLLAVIFDDVEEKKDDQFLEFDRYRVEVSVNHGKVSHSLRNLSSSKKIRSKKKRKDAA